ncbi:Ig-like domain-containing protein [Candidatus Desantisbacteria bacterium]|nr:Ig-like domain-containing protein [Candidatus Desantisbacteria bacterium]
MYMLDNAQKKDEKKCDKCGRIVKNSEWKECMYELGEAVNRGDGLIFIKTDPDTFYPKLFKDLLGVDPGGYKSDIENLALRVTDTTWSPGIEMQLASDIFKVHPTKGITRAELEFHNKKLKEKIWPAIVTNEYGRGKTVILTYEPENNLDEENRRKSELLMQRIIKYLEPDKIKEEPYEMIPLSMEIKADRACDLIARGNFDDNLELTSTDGTMTGIRDLRWNFSVQDSTDIKKTNECYILPEAKGAYLFTMLTQYRTGDKWFVYNTTEIKMEIKENINEIIDRAELSVENLETDEYDKKEYIIQKLNLIKNRGKNSIEDIDTSINDIVDCIKKIEKLEEEPGLLNEIQNIHLDLSYIMQGYEVMWYRKSAFQEPIIDTVLPEIITADPQNLAVRIAPDKIISVTFSEEMDSSSVSDSVSVSAYESVSVNGIISYNNRVATFTPVSLLTPGTTYKAVVTAGVKDLAGNGMAEDYTWSFTTASAPGTIIPGIVSTDPGDGASGVEQDKIISVSFSKEMDSTSINRTTFKISRQETVDSIQYTGEYNI